MTAPRGALACALLGALLLAGCGSDDSGTPAGSGGPAGKTAEAVKAPDSPQETLTQFAAAVADTTRTRPAG
jgi:hypothetical protein